MVLSRRIEIALRTDWDDTVRVQPSMAAVVMRLGVVEIDGWSDIGRLKQRSRVARGDHIRRQCGATGGDKRHEPRDRPVFEVVIRGDCETGPVRHFDGSLNNQGLGQRRSA